MEELNIEEQLSQASTNQDAPIDQRKRYGVGEKKATKLNQHFGDSSMGHNYSPEARKF